MSERFERMITFGPPPVMYGNPDTWTDKVRELYARLRDGDDTALAPLLEADIEFLRDGMAIAAIVGLKYDKTISPRVAKAGLARIANVIRRRPGRRGAKLPYGDRLLAELESLMLLIQDNKLIDLRRNPRALKSRVLELMEPVAGRRGLPRPEDAIPVSPETKQKACESIVWAAGNGRQGIRSVKAWALEALGHYYGTSGKDIHKRISRDLKSGLRKR